MTQTIEQQDFLQEYLKDKPDWNVTETKYFKNLSVKEIKYYKNKNLNHFYDIRISSYWYIIKEYKGAYSLDIAEFLLPQTFEKFKTIMDIFLGVENANP